MPRYGHVHKFKKGQQFHKKAFNETLTVEMLLFGGSNVSGEEELFYRVRRADGTFEVLGECQIESELRRGSWTQEPEEFAKVAETVRGWELVRKQHTCEISTAIWSNKFFAGDVIRCTDCGQHWELYLCKTGTSWNRKLAARRVSSM